MIRIFHAPRTRSTRVLWAAEELGIAYEVSAVQFGAPKPPEFLEVNPAGTLPAMRDGEVMMTESVAILQYLADRYAGGALTVKPDQANYPDYLQFLILGEAGLGAPLNAVIGTRLFGPEDQKDNWTCKMVLEGFFNRLKLVDRQLIDRPYVAGDAFTLADISVVYSLGIVTGLLGKADRFPAHILDYQRRMTERPAFQRAAAV
jgi:glutathione S-transferase